MPTNKNKTHVKRIDFNSFGKPTSIKGVRKFTLANGYTRDFNVRDISQLQDSLIARNEYNDARRLAMLSTGLAEPGHQGFASIGIGGNGILGMSKERMPLNLVGAGPVIGGKQIHYILEDIKGLHPDNWHHGGKGGLPIQNAEEGYNKFWNENDVRKATIYLNKGYIRPKAREEAWNNRVATALLLQKYMK